MENEDSDDYGIEAKRTFKPKNSVNNYFIVTILYSQLSQIKLRHRLNQKNRLNQLLLWKMSLKLRNLRQLKKL